MELLWMHLTLANPRKSAVDAATVLELLRRAHRLATSREVRYREVLTAHGSRVNFFAPRVQPCVGSWSGDGLLCRMGRG